MEFSYFFVSIFHIIIHINYGVSSLQHHQRSTLSPSVKTAYGTFNGFTEKTPGGKVVDVYLGVPYAQPPLGELRFKPTVPLQPSDKIWNATSQPKSCYQKYLPLSNLHAPLKSYRPLTELSEDCLYMNIWSPRSGKKLAPVMLYIYGGGFSRGAVSTTVHDGKYLAAEENVVVIFFNYRLGSLGFLFLDHPEVPGNSGMFDQRMAMKWVKENVEHFGGDPNSVTLFGQSAGSASIGYHLLSPLSWDYFDRAIMQSGMPTAFWAYNTRKIGYDFSVELAQNSGCPEPVGTNITNTLTCLRNMDAETLIFSEPQGLYDMVYTFRPVIDNDFLLGDQLKLYREKKFKKINVLTGTNRDEGSVFLLSFDPIVFRFNEKLSLNSDTALSLAQRLVGFGEIINDVIQILYFDPSAPDNWKTNTRLVNQGFGDSLFHCPTQQIANYITEAGGKVFKYFFTHRSSNSKWPEWVGTPHGEELFYILGFPLDQSQGFNAAEKDFSRRLMRFWANYARTGDPNISPEEKVPLEGQWPAYTLENQEYLVLAPNSTIVGKRLRARQCFFWNEFFDKLDKKDETSHTIQRCCS